MDSYEEAQLASIISKAFEPIKEALDELKTIVGRIEKVVSSIDKASKQLKTLDQWEPIGPLDQSRFPKIVPYSANCNCQYFSDNKCNYVPMRPVAEVGEDDSSAAKPRICPVVFGGKCPYNFLQPPVTTTSGPSPKIGGAPIKTGIVC